MRMSRWRSPMARRERLLSCVQGFQVDLRVVKEQSYGAALMYFTGSKAHNIALRNIANDRGWKLNEYGLFDEDRAIAGETEEGIYKKLGLQLCRRSCARIGAKSRSRRRMRCPISCNCPTFAATSMSIQIGAMGTRTIAR